TAAPEQPRILKPGHALTDREFTHLNPRSCRRCYAYGKAPAPWLPAPAPAARARGQDARSAWRRRGLMTRELGQHALTRGFAAHELGEPFRRVVGRSRHDERLHALAVRLRLHAVFEL